MDNLVYKNNRLYFENVDLSKIHQEMHSPTFIYSYKTLIEQYLAFSNAFNEIEHLICYAVKANSNKTILSLFASMGSGADIVSGGELSKAMMSGIKTNNIVYSGIGKTKNEIELGLKSNILMFNIESGEELEVVNQVAMNLGVKAPVSFRVNPDVDAKTHSKITTGLAKNKFGVDIDIAFELYLAAKRLKNIDIKGISYHIGSQLLNLQPFIDSLNRVLVLVDTLKNIGIHLEYLDIGGGLGIKYDNEAPPTPQEYATVLKSNLKNIKMKLILEPGRVIVGNAGILLTELLYLKKNKVKNFFIVDAAMNDLLRPSFYGSYHKILPVKKNNNVEKVIVDVVGPICETSDFIARDRELPLLKRGELLAILSAGAYGFSMSSNYNSRPRAAEILVKDDNYYVIRKREDIRNLSYGEEYPDFTRDKK